MSKGIEFLGADTQKGQWQILKGKKLAHDFAALTAPDDEDASITVSGARLGDPVMVAASITLPVGVVLSAFVSASDTVKVRLTANENINMDACDLTVYVFHEKDV